MPSIRNPKMPESPIVARSSSRVMLARGGAAVATAGGARSCGKGRAAIRKGGRRKRKMPAPDTGPEAEMKDETGA